MGMRTECDLAQLDGIPTGQLHHGVFTCLKKLKKGRVRGGEQELYAKEFQYTQGVTKLCF
jgi:hypothetical protein